MLKSFPRTHSLQKVWTPPNIDSPLYGHTLFLSFLWTPFFWLYFCCWQYRPNENEINTPNSHKGKLFLHVKKTIKQHYSNTRIRPFIIIYSSSTRRQKMKCGMQWLFDYLMNFYFIYFLLHVVELRVCFHFFPFNSNFDFFYQWWQIIKQNTVLFTKKLWCRQVMMNE